jgi:membrane fusion protein, multidrug efflux system
MKRRLRGGLLAGCLAITAAGGGWAWLHGAHAQSTPAAPSAPAAVPVTFELAKRQDVPVILRNIGTVQAFQSVLVRARVDGNLDEVFFQEGQEVKPGDKLAQIDPRPYMAVLDQMRAKRAQDESDMANAQRDLARYQSLAQRDFASRQQLDTQQALVGHFAGMTRQDDAAIAAAQLNLEFTTITSPIQGRTGLRMVDPGNLIHANDATGLVAITQIHPIALIFTLPQANLPAIQDAMAKGTLPVYAYAENGSALATGELLTIDNAIDQSTGTIKLKAKFANPDNRLWPGQFVTAGLRVAVQTNVIAVASTAVQHGPSGLFVYVVTPDSKVAMRPVTVGMDDGKVAVVASGVEENAQVVTNGQSRLQDGTRVAASVAKAST